MFAVLCLQAQVGIYFEYLQYIPLTSKGQPRTRTSAETNTMSQDFATGNRARRFLAAKVAYWLAKKSHADSLIQDMLLCALMAKECTYISRQPSEVRKVLLYPLLPNILTSSGHQPSKLYERIRLSQDYQVALEQIDSRLIYWPKFLIHKAKQRLTRLTQVAIRTRRLAKEEERLGERLQPKLASKVKRREETRERKAEAAAKVSESLARPWLPYTLTSFRLKELLN